MKKTEKIVKKVVQDNESGARRAVLEDLFYDFNRSKAQVYRMNFFRGISFGLGSVVGGTIVVALLIWLLNTIGWLIPSLADLVDGIITTMQSRK
ncbi:MAG: DUF5665 domain-containing protein [Candidatus Saccharimonas sp.]